jgi:hypothetical protein
MFPFNQKSIFLKKIIWVQVNTLPFFFSAMTNFYYCEIQDHNGIAEVNCKGESLAEVQNKVDRLLPRKTVNLVGGRGRSAMATGQQIVGARMCTVRMRLLSAAVLRPDLNPKP